MVSLLSVSLHQKMLMQIKLLLWIVDKWKSEMEIRDGNLRKGLSTEGQQL
jgi:hypothetical protein